jgi:hypothetical protein
MAELSHLEILHLGGAAGLPDLAPLRHLDELHDLFLYGDDDVDLTPLAGKEGLEVTIMSLRERRVFGHDKLGRTSKVVAF